VTVDEFREAPRGQVMRDWVGRHWKILSRKITRFNQKIKRIMTQKFLS
jgi:hypothetical protein